MFNPQMISWTSVILTALKVVWAGPNSILGLLIGAGMLAMGGRGALVRGACEFSGGRGAKWFLWLPNGPIAAITFGHVILGASPESLQRARDHEHVHIRQYERWGPLFIPAYLMCSMVLFFLGRDMYRDNPFEVEAYREAP
jgi:hypothetical protein